MPYRIGEDCLDRVMNRRKPRHLLARLWQALLPVGGDHLVDRARVARISPRLELLTVDC